MVEETHAVAQAVEASGGIGTLGINLNIFIAQLINFLIVVLVLWRFAYKPVVKLLDDRQKKVEESLIKAEDIDKRLGVIESQRTEILEAAKTQATQVLVEARAQSEAQKQALLEKAKEEVRTVIEQGKAQLQSEKQHMIREAKQEMVALIVSATEKILKEQVTQKQSEALTKAALESLK